MNGEPLRILVVAMFLPTPATRGIQRRVEGLMKALSRRHEVSVICYADPLSDAPEGEAAMREYCKAVTLVQPSFPNGLLSKRLQQSMSLFSRRSFVHRQVGTRAFQRALDDLLARETFDVVNVELPFMAHFRFEPGPGRPRPLLVLDEHNIEFDLARQSAAEGLGLARRAYNTIDYLKIRREEVAVWRRFDGTLFASELDQARACKLLPGIRSAVVPNAVDVDYFRPRPTAPPSDGKTLLFFGTQRYFPNLDGLLYFLREVWPVLSRRLPHSRVKIVGDGPAPEVLACRGPRVEVTGLVDDVRPHLASAAVIIVPLRLGGGTRFKIVEAMAMEKAIVSTTTGAEGLEVAPGRHLLLGDDPRTFTEGVARALEEPGLATAMGKAARALVESRYSWEASVSRQVEFFRTLPGRATRTASGIR